MTKKLILKPAIGKDGAPLVVRDPATREPLPKGGARKPHTRYWLRRLRERSVVQVTDELRTSEEG